MISSFINCQTDEWTDIKIVTSCFGYRRIYTIIIPLKMECCSWETYKKWMDYMRNSSNILIAQYGNWLQHLVWSINWLNLAWTLGGGKNMEIKLLAGKSQFIDVINRFAKHSLKFNCKFNKILHSSFHKLLVVEQDRLRIQKECVRPGTSTRVRFYIELCILAVLLVHE